MGAIYVAIFWNITAEYHPPACFKAAWFFQSLIAHKAAHLCGSDAVEIG